MLRLVLLVWLAMAAGAAAQTVTVRSGEHGEFTRLVLTFPEPGGWDFGRTGAGYGFHARNPRWRYDMSTVFDLIPRDRLAALWVDPDTGVLRLGLGCDCHAIATPFRNGIVVVDIRPGQAPPDSPQEQALDNPGRSLPQLVARPTQRPRARPADFLPPPADPPAPWHAPARTRPVPLPLAAPDPRATDLQARLLEELARGIAAGALAPSGRMPARQAEAGPRLLPAPLPAPDRPVQMQVQADGDAARALSETGQACIPDDRLDVASWGTDDPPARQIAMARSGLLGEFDRLDRDRLLALIRLHIHLGFGAEGRLLLAAWPPQPPDAPILEALAAIVDGGLAEGAFRSMASCDGRAALWAVLAQAAPPDPAHTDRAAVLRAFSELPPGLRRYLGVALADRFLAAGDAETARAIRDGIGRALGDGNGTVTLIDARLDLRSGATEAAERKLDTVVREDRDLSPRALSDLVESRIRRGEDPGPEMAAQLEALMREHRGAEAEGPLRQALAKTLILTGDAPRAFSALATQDPALGPQLWDLLAARGEDLAVAERALVAAAAARDLPGATRQAVARRLIAAGFPEAAAPWLSGLTGPGPALLRAQAALSGRDGRAALREIAGETGPEADRLRARALELLGDPAASHEAWIAAGDPEEARRMLLQARRWAELAPAPPPLEPLLAALADPSPQDAPPLARAKALLEASSTTRQAAGALHRAAP